MTFHDSSYFLNLGFYNACILCIQSSRNWVQNLRACTQFRKLRNPEKACSVTAKTHIFTLGAFSIVYKSFRTPTLGRQVNTMYNLALEHALGKNLRWGELNSA